MSVSRKGANGLPVRSAPWATLFPFSADPRVNRGTADEYNPVPIVDDRDASPGTFADPDECDGEAGPCPWAGASDWPEWIDDLVFELDALQAQAEAESPPPEPEPAAGRGVPLLTSTLGRVS